MPRTLPPGTAAAGTVVRVKFRALLAKLPGEELRQIARLRLEEYSSAEIAERLGCTERTVSRKLVLIRSYWEKDAPR